MLYLLSYITASPATTNMGLSFKKVASSTHILLQVVYNMQYVV